MTKYPYLTRLGKRGFWRYRRRIPEHLRPLMGGKWEIVKCFGSSDRDEIILDYHMFAAETDEALDWAQQEFEVWEEERAVEAEGGYTIINDLIPQLLGEATSEPPHLCQAPQDLAAACAQHYQWCKEAEQQFRYETTKRVTADPDAFWRGDIAPLPMSQDEFYGLPQFAYLKGTGDGYKYLLAMAYTKRLENLAVVLRAKLATQDVEAVAANYGSCRQCARSYGLALIATELQLINDLLTNDAALVPAVPPVKERGAVPAQSASSTDNAPRLSEAVKQWIEAGSKGKSAWSQERRNLCERVMADFIEICGDKPVGEYKKSDGREFVQLLRRLPANLEKRRAALGPEARSLREIADVAERKGIPPQDDNNANKKIGIVHQCFSWMTMRRFFWLRTVTWEASEHPIC